MIKYALEITRENIVLAAKTKDSQLSVLRQQIKENNLSNIYLFYGEETFLKDKYVNDIRECIPANGFEDFNHLYFNGHNIPVAEYDDAWEGFPMMAEKRFIYIKDSQIFRTTDSGLFKKPDEEKKQFWIDKLSNPPQDTVVIFDESNVDKRSVIYKALTKIGTPIEFKYQSEADLVTYTLGRAMKAQKKMQKDVATYFVSLLDEGLLTLNNELEKLFMYCDAEITRTDVDKVVSKGLNIQIFELTDGIIEHNGKKAMKILTDLKNSGERAFPILYLILSNAQKLLKTKIYSGLPNSELAKKIGVGPYFVEKYKKSAQGFSESMLIEMVSRIPEIDMEIKEGAIDEWTALEQYIAKSIYFSS